VLPLLDHDLIAFPERRVWLWFKSSENICNIC